MTPIKPTQLPFLFAFSTLVFLLLSGCADKKNPKDKIDELRKATEVFCVCTTGQLDQPLAKIDKAACQPLSKAWNEVSKSMPVGAGDDPAFDKLVTQWRTCSELLSSAGKR